MFQYLFLINIVGFYYYHSHIISTKLTAHTGTISESHDESATATKRETEEEKEELPSKIESEIEWANNPIDDSDNNFFNMPEEALKPKVYKKGRVERQDSTVIVLKEL